MAVQHALKSIDGSHPRHRSCHPGPLAADSDSGFARFFVPALLAALLTTAGLAWESWDAERPQTAIGHLSF
jgi:hypothetical protein